jgi:hypothetical protein
MFGPDTPMPEDPTRRDAPYEQGGLEQHPLEQQALGGDTKPSRKAQTKEGVPEPCLYFRPNMDPDLPAAVALLRSRLKQQHGLKINIPLILSSIYARFEQASDALQTMSVEEGRAQHMEHGCGQDEDHTG